MTKRVRTKPKTAPSGMNNGRKYPCGGKLQKKSK